MQIASEIVKTRVQNPRGVKLENSKLVFAKKKVERVKGKVLTKEGKNSLVEQMWINRMSAPITVKKEGQPDEIILPAKLQAQENLKKQQQLARERKEKQKQQTDPNKNFPKPVIRRGRNRRGNDTGT